MKIAFPFSTLRELLFLLSHPRLWFRKGLEKTDLFENPFRQFEKWYSTAKSLWFHEFPNAMVLSTRSIEEDIEARWVLMKGFDERGFVFYTNTESAKGRALAADPRCALSFYWDALQWQVRIQGKAVPVSKEEADSYFASRPRASQLGAWASDQSREAKDRTEIQLRLKEIEETFAGQPVPRPPHWSGYRVIPKSFEFWELRLSRLHDRFRYELQETGTWTIRRLFP